ncbi:RHS repeat-associated core domain-containing protein [Reichenbachiella sp. MALMAid0571]|uniref:RHS repeat-associated core domain-containing protein n=1 Tax=Reichenbachiella sp. MALMAid0571 TaxID=3143939 RepID=UPI0032DE76C3
MKGRDFVSEVNYSLEVKEGDKLELDVNVFFVEDDNDEVFPGLMGFLASSFGVSNGIGSETAQIYDGLENASGLLALSLTNSSNAPRAYLMCMVFDQDYVLIDPTAGGYDFYAPVPEAAATETQNISLEIDIPENAKYIYTYVANESAGTNVFFDDFTVAQLGVDITQTTDYYPFGSILSHWQKENYRFGYQGEFAEEDEETGFNHFELREYDPIVGKFLIVDPKRIGFSPYIGMSNNPIRFTDPDGGGPEDIIVTNKQGKALFTVDDGREEITTMTAIDFYKTGNQWFSPNADNYMPLISVSPELTSLLEKNFTWQDIVDFSEQTFGAPSFAQYGDADWKRAAEGADGHFLVTVNGKPYWADAIGQIPFGIWAYKETGSLKDVITLGFQFDNGSPLNVLKDNVEMNNHFDIYWVIRAARYAHGRYYSIGNGMYQERNKIPSPNILGSPINKKLF